MLSRCLDAIRKDRKIYWCTVDVGCRIKICWQLRSKQKFFSYCLSPAATSILTEYYLTNTIYNVKLFFFNQSFCPLFYQEDTSDNRRAIIKYADLRYDKFKNCQLNWQHNKYIISCQTLICNFLIHWAVVVGLPVFDSDFQILNNNYFSPEG